MYYMHSLYAHCTFLHVLQGDRHVSVGVGVGAHQQPVLVLLVQDEGAYSEGAQE